MYEGNMLSGCEESKEPKPDALAPDVLREEIVNLIQGSLGGERLPRHKAEARADAVLAKLMQFYAAVATPELTAEAHTVNDKLHALQFSADRALEAGAALSGNMGGDARWQNAALGLRTAIQDVLELLA